MCVCVCVGGGGKVIAVLPLRDHVIARCRREEYIELVQKCNSIHSKNYDRFYFQPYPVLESYDAPR